MSYSITMQTPDRTDKRIALKMKGSAVVLNPSA
jgi:hypothetical protein